MKILVSAREFSRDATGRKIQMVLIAIKLDQLCDHYINRSFYLSLSET